MGGGGGSKKFQIKIKNKNLQRNTRGQTCAESHFFKEKSSQVMTLNFFKGPLENTFRRFLQVPIDYLINI
jgi:hypothetical protein